VSSTRGTETKKRVPGRKKKGLCQQDRPVIEPNAAGVDVGAREMYVAISPDRLFEIGPALWDAFFGNVHLDRPRPFPLRGAGFDRDGKRLGSLGEPGHPCSLQSHAPATAPKTTSISPASVS
jgi:hypothetical protein